jgi:hypothetical protein
LALENAPCIERLAEVSGQHPPLCFGRDGLQRPGPAAGVIFAIAGMQFGETGGYRQAVA